MKTKELVTQIRINEYVTFFWWSNHKSSSVVSTVYPPVDIRIKEELVLYDTKENYLRINPQYIRG